MFVCSLLAQANEVLFTAEYKGKHSGFNVTTTRSLERIDKENYRFISEAKSWLASIKEVSEFSIDGNNKLIPQSYHYKRSILGAKKEEDIRFDWQNKTATYKEAGKPDKTTVHESYIGLLDPSLYQLQLQRDMLNGEAVLDYEFVRHRRIKNYQFTLAGEDTLDVNGKTYDAVKVERVDDDKRTVLWLIPELHYQLGQIQHIEDGDQYTMRMTSYTSDPALFGTALSATTKPAKVKYADDSPSKPAE